MKNSNRQLDLSAKFLQMGQALMDEGRDNNNPTITLIGTNLIFLGGIILSDSDVKKFSELVSMFSAKKLLDSMGSKNNSEYRKLGDDITYDEIIAKLKKLKEDNEDSEDSSNNEK